MSHQIEKQDNDEYQDDDEYENKDEDEDEQEDEVKEINKQSQQINNSIFLPFGANNSTIQNGNMFKSQSNSFLSNQFNDQPKFNQQNLQKENAKSLINQTVQQSKNLSFISYQPNPGPKQDQSIFNSVSNAKSVDHSYQDLPRCQHHFSKQATSNQPQNIKLQQEYKRQQFNCKDHFISMDYVCVDSQCQEFMLICSECIAFANRHQKCNQNKQIQKIQDFLNMFYMKKQTKDCGKCKTIITKLIERLQEEKQQRSIEIQEKQSQVEQLQNLTNQLQNPRKDVNPKENLHKQHLEQLYKVKDMVQYEQILKAIKKNIQDYPQVDSYNDQIEQVKDYLYPEQRQMKIYKMVIENIYQLQYIRENVLKLQLNLKYQINNQYLEQGCQSNKHTKCE